MFPAVTWPAGATQAWKDQVFDGDLNPYALVAAGQVSIALPAVAADGDEDGLTVDGGLRSYNGNIALTADEIDFLGGAASVAAPAR